MPRQKVEGKKALPSAPPPPVPQKKVKGKKALPSARPVDPPVATRCTQGTIPRETTPLGVTDKDILCWLNQELYHMEIDEPCVWTLAVTYIKRVPRWMQMVELGSTLDDNYGLVLSPHLCGSMTKKGCTGLCVPSIVVSSWSVSLFGFGNP